MDENSQRVSLINDEEDDDFNKFGMNKRLVKKKGLLRDDCKRIMLNLFFSGEDDDRLRRM